MSRLVVLIASPLELEHVERIAAFDPERVEVLHEPDLLPAPRYEGDHIGLRRELEPAELARWNDLLARAEVMWDFDFVDLATLPERAPRLRWIQGTSAGLGELLERTGLARSRLVFTTAAGAHGSALAEFVVLALLYFVKDVPFLARLQAERRWQRHTQRSLAGQRLLLVGLGAMGREIARACAALGVEVWGMRRSAGGEPPPGVARLVPREELRAALADVDALVLMAPDTAETRHLIGAEELAAMRPSAVLVNVGRGSLVDEAALVRALREGRLGGAALDVFEREPLPPESELWALPNVLVCPHSASTIPGENSRLVEIFLDNLGRYLDGRPLRNLFDPERGY